LPILTRDDLEKSVKDAGDVIQRLLDATDSAKAAEDAKTGVIHNLGKGAKSVCVHVKPFFQTFLAVAVQGSAVISCCNFLSLPTVNLYVDSNSQPFWFVGQWSLDID